MRGDYDAKTNIPAEYVIIDEAHRDGYGRDIVYKAQRSDSFSLKFLLLLTANVVHEDNSSDESATEVIPIRFIHGAPIDVTGVPECIPHYHEMNWIAKKNEIKMSRDFPTLPDLYREVELDSGEVLLMGLSPVYLARDIVALTMCALGMAVSYNNPNSRIVCYVPISIALPLKVTNVLPLVSGYKIFVIRGGSNNIKAIESFHAHSTKAILFLTYKAAATGFSIDADEVFLFASLQSTLAYTYQACKRLERVTNMRKVIHAHYIEKTPLGAIYSRHASRYDSLGVKVPPMDNSKRIAKRFAILSIDAKECSPEVFLFLCNPTFVATISDERLREQIPSTLLARYKELATI